MITIKRCSFEGAPEGQRCEAPGCGQPAQARFVWDTAFDYASAQSPFFIDARAFPETGWWFCWPHCTAMTKEDA